MADLSAIGGGIQIPVQVNVQESGRKISDVYRELDQTKTASEKLARALKEAFKFDNANLRSFTDLANAIKNISQQVRTASDNITSFGRGSQSIERLKSDMVALQQAMARTASGAKMSNTELAKSYIEVGKAVDAVTRSLTSARTGTGGPGGVSNFLIGSSNLKAYTKDLNDLKAVYGELGKTLASGKWSNASGSIASGGGATGSMAWLKKPLQEVEDQFKKTKASAETFWGTLGGKIGNVVVYAGMYKLIGAVVDLGAQFVITAAKMEQLRAAYNGVFGAQSGAQFEYVTQTANKYGKAIDDVSASYLKFAASTDYMGMSADTTKRIFEATTQAITKVGGSSEDVKGTLMAMQQMLSKGTVMSEEFRLQFAERIPGAMKMGADALGVTTAEFKKMMEEGKVIASDFLPKLVEQMEKFAVGWEKSADTLTANWTRLGNAFKQFVGDQSTGLTQSLNATVKWAANSVDAVNSFLKNKDTRDRYTWYLMKGVEGFEGGKSVKDMRDQLKFFESQSDKAQVAELSRVLDARRKASFGFTSLMDGDLENLINTKQRGIDQEDFVAKAKEFIESTIKAGNVSQENADKVIWFKSAIESITKQPYEIRLGVDLSGIDNAMNAINSLFKHTKEYAAEQAELSLTQTNARLEENKAKLEQMRSGSPDMLLRGDILKTMEAIRKDEANQKMLEDKAFDARRNVALNTPTRRQLKQLQDAVGSNATKRQKVDMVNMNLVSAWEYANSMERQGVWTSEQGAAYNAEALKAHRQGLDDIAKSGAGAANAVGDLTAKTEAFAYQAMKFSAEARGDSLTSGLMDIEAWAVEQQNKINKLGKRADAMGMGQKEFDSLKQAKFLNEYTKEYEKQNKALADQLSILGDIESSPALKMQAENMKLEMEYGEKAQTDLRNSISEHRKLYDSLGEGQSEQKAILAAIIEAEEKRLGYLPEILVKKQEELKVQQRINELQDKATYAEMTGNPREALSAQIELKQQLLNKLSQEEGNLYKIKILQEEISRLEAKRNMNVGKLIDMGMADYANKTYEELANKISTAIPQALDQFGDAISGNLTDLISGAKTAEQAWADMGKTMQQAILRIIIDIGILIAKMELLRALGYDTGDSLNQVQKTGGQATPNSMLSSVTSGQNKSFFEGMSKSVTEGLNKWGYEKMGIGSDPLLSVARSNPTAAYNAGMDYREITNAKSLPATKTGLGTMAGAGLGGALMGAGLGAGIGSFVYANGTGSIGGTIGGALGGLGGAIGGSVLGGTLGAALGPIGAIIGGLAGSLLTGGSTTKTEKIGSGLSVTINGGINSYSGYNAYKQTTSGMFGSSSTSHFITKTTADPDMVRAFSQGMEDYNKKMVTASRYLGLSTSSYKNFSFPGEMNFPAEYTDKVTRNLSNLKAEIQLDEEGKKAEFDQYLKEGEAYVDAITRLGDAMKNGIDVVEQFGYSIDTLSGGMTELGKADYVSRLSDAVGGYSELSSVIQTLSSHMEGNVSTFSTQVETFGSRFTRASAMIGEAGVTQENFWEKFNTAMQTSMDPEKFADWADAATALDTLEKAKQALEDIGNALRFAFSDLEIRALIASGREEEAEMMKMQIQWEQELIQARKDSMPEEYIARLKEVQELERQRVVWLKELERIKYVDDTNRKIVEDFGTFDEQIAQIRKDNAAEELDIVWKYGYEAVDALRKLHELELDEKISAYNDQRNAYKKSLLDDMASRRLVVEGRDAEANALKMLAGYAQEISDALGNGVDANTIDSLMALQKDELAKYWKDIMDELKRSLGEVADTLADRLEDIRGKLTDYTNGQLDAANEAYNLAKQTADAYKSAGQTIRDTLTGLKSGDLSSLNAGDKYNAALGRWNEVYAKGMTGDLQALEEASSVSQVLLNAAKEAMTSGGDYSQIFGKTTTQLAELGITADALGFAGDYQASLLERQINILELINSELSKANPDTTLLQESVQALGIIGELLEGTRDVAVRLDDTADPLRQAVNSQTGQVVRIGNISLEQAEQLLKIGQKTIDTTGAVVEETKDSNTYLELQNSLLVTGNATQDILSQFSEKNITVSNQIRDAIQGKQDIANTYLNTMSQGITEMISLMATFVELSNEQKAAAQEQLKRAEVAALESQYMASRNAAAGAFQNSFQGNLVQQMALTATGWSGGIDHLMSSSYWPGGNLSWRADYSMQQGAASITDFSNWFKQNYGVGTGYVDWWGALQKWVQSDQTTSQLTGTDLNGNILDALNQTNTLYQQWQTLKQQYGFADGGISYGPQLAWVSEGAYSAEAHVPLPDGRSIPVNFGGGFLEPMVAEMRAARDETRQMLAEVKDEIQRGNFYLIRNSNDSLDIQKKWEFDGLPTTRTE